MIIKTRIKLGIILSLVLATTIALLIFFAARALNEASRLEGIAVEVIKGVAEIKIVTHEYILHPEERSLMQWRSRYISLSKLLTGGHFKNPDDKIAADQIFKNLERFKTVFSALTTGLKKGETPGNQESSAFRELQDKLMDELLMKSRLAISLAFQLQQRIEAKLITTQKRVSLLTLFLLLTLTAAIVGISLWINRSIGRPIAKLERDARIIGSGNLDHKVGTTAKDEIGELSRAFDKMTQNLKETTTSIVALNKEIDERKQAEEALRESEEKYRTILENIEDGYYEVDIDGNFTFFNDALCDIYGSPENELMGINIRKPTDQETAKRWYKVFNKVNTTGRPEKGFDWEIIRKDGTKRVVEASVSLRRNVKGEPVGFRGIVRDISEKQRLEDKLHRAQKMESLGLMAGGIAHDLNNILSGLVSYPELLLLDIPVDSPMRKPMETIKKSGMRAVDVVSDLITIARGVATVKEVLNLNTIVTEYLGSAEHQKLERTHSFIDFKAELNPDLLNLNGSSTHINKTLMNLVVNASEAIEGTGTVTISTTNRYLDEPLKGYEDVRIGEYAVLSVSDDGSGISSEDLEKIFEPFYTKKVMGRSGTGLGLAVVWNSVQDHNGYIDVKSSEEGTVFELYFRVTRDQIAEDTEDVPAAEYQGHGEKILVVDDEENQREIACGMLTKLGYIAEAVSSGEEAIEYVKKNPVDLIVLDMVMPKGINGRKTYEEIIKIRPGQKAIIASGHAKTKEVDLAQELGAGKYIKKPYTLEKIGIAVKEELEK